jgi:type IX secretion system PorP/SprF family membrane protein
MKKKCKTLALLWILILFNCSAILAQQLPQFSQYMFNGLHVNPGYAGYKNVGYIQTTYRNQWVNFPGSPETISITADFSGNQGRMGFGLSILQDKLGPTESRVGLLTYAYRVRLSPNSRLGLGMSAGFAEYRMDPTLLEENDPNDPLIPLGLVRKTTPTINTGLFFNNKKYYVGFSAFNMIGKASLEAEDVSLAYHDFHYYLTMGGILRLSEEIQFKPSTLVKHVKGSPTSFDLNAMFLIDEKVCVGAAYRSNVRLFDSQLQEREELNKRTALVGLFELMVTDNLRLGYAYDHNMNALNTLRSSSHEFSLGYYLRSSTTIMKNPRWF